MTTLMLLLLMASPAQGDTRPPQEIQALLVLIAESGRVHTIAEPPSERLTPSAKLAPGRPPLLAFRYFDGQRRHRFGNLDLVMDDAGH